MTCFISLYKPIETPAFNDPKPLYNLLLKGKYHYEYENKNKYPNDMFHILVKYIVETPAFHLSINHRLIYMHNELI